MKSVLAKLGRVILGYAISDLFGSSKQSRAELREWELKKRAELDERLRREHGREP